MRLPRYISSGLATSARSAIHTAKGIVVSRNDIAPKHAHAAFGARLRLTDLSGQDSGEVLVSALDGYGRAWEALQTGAVAKEQTRCATSVKAVAARQIASGPSMPVEREGRVYVGVAGDDASPEVAMRSANRVSEAGDHEVAPSTASRAASSSNRDCSSLRQRRGDDWFS